MRPQGFDRQCAAKSKRSQERCRNFACRGSHVCRMHGGKSRRGVTHPRFKDGRHGTSSPFATRVALCPKCRRRHGTEAERESRERALSAKFLRAYALGHGHGYRDGHRDGFAAGQDAARKAAARQRGARGPERQPEEGG
jgi:hypothetical protein